MTPAFINVTGLGTDEIRVLEYIRDRLRMGQEQYGRLDIATDPRDWPAEAAAEAGDLTVYASLEVLKRLLKSIAGPAPVRRVASEGI